MKFKTLSIQNFLTFRNTAINLSDRGLVLILGENKSCEKATSNGAGKTAILDAICWCLWGKTSRELGHDDVVNRFVKKDCKVELTVELDSGTVLTIVRTRKVKGNAKPNDLLLFIDGAADATSVADTQDKINKSLGLDFNTFRCMMVGAGIHIASLTDSEIKTLIESILDTNVLAAAQDRAKQLAKDALKKLHTATAQLDTATKLLSVTETRLEHNTKLASTWADDKNQSLLELDVTKEKLRTAYDAQLLKIQNDLDTTRSSLQIAHDEIVRARIQHTEMEGLDLEATEMWREAKSKHELLRSEVADLQRKLYNANELSHTCSTCDQPVPEAYKISLIDTLHEALSEAEVKAEEARQIVREWFWKSEEYNRELHTLRNHLRSAEQYVPELEKSLENFEIQRAAAETHYKYQLALIDQQSKQIVDSLKENPHTAVVEMLEGDKTKAEEDIKQLEADISTLKVEVANLDYWVQGFSIKGIRNHMLDSVIPLLNKSVAHYCKLLMNDELTITFNTHRMLKNGSKKEEFYIAVEYKNGGESYLGASKGEKARVDLAIACAIGDLAQCRVRQVLGFRFFDEPFESVDGAGQEAILELLKEQEKNYGTVFCVTHEPSFQQLFTKTLKVIKTGNTSEIYE